MEGIKLSRVMKYGSPGLSGCDHSWGNANDGGVSKCSECKRESVMRTSIPVKVLNDSVVNEAMVFLGESYGDVYNLVIKILCEEYELAYAQAVESCDEYAKEKKLKKFMPKSGNLSRHLTSVYDFNKMLTVWRDQGMVDDSVSSHVQRADIKRARSAFLQKYTAHRNGISAMQKTRDNNQKARDHNANLPEGENKKRVKHPRRKDHSKSAIDMTNPKPMLRDKEPLERLSFSTVAEVSVRGENRDIIKVTGIPEFRIPRSIPEGADIRSAYFRERTRHIRENMEPSKRLWEVRFSMRCFIPEKQETPDETEKIISADTGCKNHIATSEEELWSAPAQDASHRKTRVWQQQNSTHHKNGSRKHRRIANKTSKETTKRTNRKKSAKEQKAAEIAYEADIIILENHNHENMKASAKGTLDKPGRNVAAKRGLNRVLQHAAMGETQTIMQRAAQNLNKLCGYVNPQYTSQRCSKCGEVYNTIRKGELFMCLVCGHKTHADINATKNMIYLYKGGKVNLKFKNGKVVVPGRISPSEKASLISISTAPEPVSGNHADIDPIQAKTSRDGPAVPAIKRRRKTETVV